MSVIAVVYIILNYFNGILVERYKKLLDETYKGNDTILKYCLRHIEAQAANDGDYETAIKCRDLIQQLEKFETKKQ